MGKHHTRPRTTREMINRVEDLAEDLAGPDTEIKGFHDALTVVVEHVEDG